MTLPTELEPPMIAWLREEVPNILLADGLDAALLGFAQRCGQPPVAVYDYAACIEVLTERGRLNYEEAVEHMDVNVTGSWVGPETPCFLIRPIETRSPMSVVPASPTAQSTNGLPPPSLPILAPAAPPFSRAELDAPIPELTLQEYIDQAVKAATENYRQRIEQVEKSVTGWMEALERGTHGTGGMLLSATSAQDLLDLLRLQRAVGKNSAKRVEELTKAFKDVVAQRDALTGERDGLQAKLQESVAAITPGHRPGVRLRRAKGKATRRVAVHAPVVEAPPRRKRLGRPPGTKNGTGLRGKKGAALRAALAARQALATKVAEGVVKRAKARRVKAKAK